MRAHGAGRIGDLIKTGSYRDLRVWLAAVDRPTLARGWPRLKPLHKLIAFKLMDAASALAFYRSLPYEERYFIFCGFPLQSIAPVLAEAPASMRRLFVQLPAKFYGVMLQDLVSTAKPGMSNFKT